MERYENIIAYKSSSRPTSTEKILGQINDIWYGPFRSGQEVVVRGLTIPVIHKARNSQCCGRIFGGEFDVRFGSE
jgi:hypothetical protein